MTQPTGQQASAQQFKSTRSGRLVVPGWMNLVPGKPDAVEVQLDVVPEDLGRDQASLLIEYWATPDDLTLQSVLPIRAFSASQEGWCALVPAAGRVLVRAIDPQPTPPVLASHWINVDPATVPGTTVHVRVAFPAAPSPVQNLLHPRS
ncbi:uracil-DNA glycosylase [Deinococcus sp. HMF7620]|uniref:Uracil-DNA glycosylase n=1 Tax=Deinococcus arboris TaxID=2682977 RepID=A0A7C9HSX1_9DEIO|nr:uracil-DNA glycosylase [Deinococcus arboris]MVN88033.1 uracil-DNA glycosylase [Deinococcus arboris]